MFASASGGMSSQAPQGFAMVRRQLAEEQRMDLTLSEQVDIDLLCHLGDAKMAAATTAARPLRAIFQSDSAVLDLLFPQCSSNNES